MVSFAISIKGLRVKNFKKVAAGKFSVRAGDAFEVWLEKAMWRAGWHLIQIHDGCIKTGPGGKVLKPIRQPFDFVGIGPNNQDIFFDAKFRSGFKKITPSILKAGIDKKGRPDSMAHQTKKLNEISAIGRKAGFVVFLKDTAQIFWVPVESINDPKPILWGNFGSILNIKFED